MNYENRPKKWVPLTPCPPEEFSGRFDERELIRARLSEASEQGQPILITGARGSGKSSLLNWIGSEIKNLPGGEENIVIEDRFREISGVAFKVYCDILSGLRKHEKLNWVSKALKNPKLNHFIDTVLSAADKASEIAGPAKPAIGAGTALARGVMQTGVYDYQQLFASYKDALRGVSEALVEDNRFLVILIDDIHWATGDDFHVQRELIQDLPPRIFWVGAFRLQSDNLDKCEALRGEYRRFDNMEVHLGGMKPKEIDDLLRRRYGLEVSKEIIAYLSGKMGDPFTLITCFRALQKKELELSMDNLKEFAQEAVEAAECFYSTLSSEDQKYVNTLCVLHPPMPLSVMAGMLGIRDEQLSALRDDLKASPAFDRLEGEIYDFAHASLREYRRGLLSDREKVILNTKAAECIENSIDQYPERTNAMLALAEHLFEGQEYEKAWELNLELGDRFYHLFTYDLALELTKRAVTCAERTEDRENLAHAKHQKGMILHMMFNYQEAIDAYNGSLAISREIGNREGEAATMHQIGRFYEETNRFDEALDHYNQSLAINREIGDRESEAKSLRQIGIVHRKNNRFDESLDYCNQSLAIESDLGNRAGEAMTLHQIGIVYEMDNHFDEALDHYNQSLAIDREIGDRAGEASTLHQIGMVYHKNNHFDKALDHYNQSLAIERDLGDRAGEASTLHQIGMVYQMDNRFTEALDHYDQSLAINRELGNQASEAMTLGQIGVLYMVNGEPKQAREFLKNALAIFQEIGDKANTEKAIENLKALEEMIKEGKE